MVFKYQRRFHSFYENISCFIIPKTPRFQSDNNTLSSIILSKFNNFHRNFFVESLTYLEASEILLTASTGEKQGHSCFKSNFRTADKLLEGTIETVTELCDIQILPSTFFISSIILQALAKRIPSFRFIKKYNHVRVEIRIIENQIFTSSKWFCLTAFSGVLEISTYLLMIRSCPKP